MMSDTSFHVIPKWYKMIEYICIKCIDKEGAAVGIWSGQRYIQGLIKH